MPRAFLQHGGKRFHFIPCLNERDDWIRALARDLHRTPRQLAGAAGRASNCDSNAPRAGARRHGRRTTMKLFIRGRSMRLPRCCCPSCLPASGRQLFRCACQRPAAQARQCADQATADPGDAADHCSRSACSRWSSMRCCSGWWAMSWAAFTYPDSGPRSGGDRIQPAHLAGQPGAGRFGARSRQCGRTLVWMPPGLVFVRAGPWPCASGQRRWAPGSKAPLSLSSALVLA